jgi:hypothetical protein
MYEPLRVIHRLCKVLLLKRIQHVRMVGRAVVLFVSISTLRCGETRGNGHGIPIHIWNEATSFKSGTYMQLHIYRFRVILMNTLGRSDLLSMHHLSDLTDIQQCIVVVLQSQGSRLR